MKKFLKINTLFICIVALLVTLSVLASCGFGSNSTDNSTNSNVQSSTNVETSTEDGSVLDSEPDDGNVDNSDVGGGVTDDSDKVHVHTEETIPAKEATCTETGLTEGKMCSTCDEILVAQKTIEAKGHVLTDLAAVEPTCTNNGYTAGVGCSVCGVAITAQDTIPAKGHQFKENSYECSVCLFTKNASEGLEYVLNYAETEYTLVGRGTCDDHDIVIPYYYEGKPVTSIKSAAFKKDSIGKLTLPNSIISIGMDAFYSCSIGELHFESIESWCKIEFVNSDANPMSRAEKITSDKPFIENDTVVIPDTVERINEYAFYEFPFYESHIIIGDGVTEIGAWAFASSNAKKYTFGKNVEIINEWAFNNCWLNELVIGESVKYIGESAFSNCQSLKTVEISASVEKIMSDAFIICEHIQSFTVDGNNNFYKSVDGVLYTKDGKTLVRYPSSKKDKEFVVPDYVITIGAYSFHHNGELTKVTLGKNTKSIGTSAFTCSELLKEVVLPDGFEGIGSSAFWICDELETINFPHSLDYIGGDAFYACINLKSVLIHLGTSVGSLAFNQCENITIYCEALEKPDNWAPDWNWSKCPVEWGVNAKWNNGYRYVICEDKVHITKCTGYSGNVEIPSEIEGYPVVGLFGAFNGNSSVTGIRLPKGIEYIYDSTFENCTSLKSINLPDSLKTIGRQAFEKCESLEAISIPNSIEIIEPWTFFGCKSLKRLEIGTGVTTIESYAFHSCSNLSQVVFPNSLTCIESSAFDWCGFSSITIPQSVQTIGGAAFARCTNLTDVNYLGTLKDWCSIQFSDYDANPLHNGAKLLINGELVTDMEITSDISKVSSYAFYNYDYLENVTIKEGLAEIGNFTFYGCDKLQSITLPQSLNKIGVQAFSRCQSLTGIYVNENNTEYKDIDGNLYSKNEEVLIQYAIAKTDKAFVVPDTVKTIDSNAFALCKNIENIEFSKNLTRIYSYAFLSCSNLKQIDIPKGVDRIGDGAFSSCTSLSYVVIPNGVSYVGKQAFYSCGNVVIYNANESKVIGTWHENWIGNHYNVSGYEDFVKIDNVFYGILNDEAVVVLQVKSITEANIVDSIDYNGTEVKVTKIANSAFINCVGLSSVTIGANVKSIGQNAFKNTSALTQIIYNATEVENFNKGDTVFFEAGKDGDGISVTIGKNVKSIPEYFLSDGTLYNQPNVTSVTFEGDSQCESIGANAFYGCTGLTSITLVPSLNDIGEGAFDECTGLTEINYYTSQLSAFTQTFQAFKNVGTNGITVNVAEHVGKIPAYLFYSDAKITKINFEGSSNCKSIGKYAFYNCDTLVEANLPNSLEKIDKYSFYGCSNLDTSIPDSVIELGEYSFYGCEALRSVNIPKGLKKLNPYTFYGCTGLVEITYNSSCLEDLQEENNVFYKAGENGSGIILTIGEEITEIPAHLFNPCSDGNCVTMKSVTFNEGVCTKIGESAFKGCILQLFDKVDYRNSFEDWCNIDFGDTYSNPLCFGNNLYIQGNLVTNLEFPESITKINNYTFAGGNFESVEIPSHIVSIGAFAFSSSSGFTNLTIPDNVESIGISAFASCKDLKELVICDGVKEICERAFAACRKLETAVIGNGVVTIGRRAFDDCGIKTLTIGEGVKTVGQYAFYLPYLAQLNFNAIAMDDLGSHNEVFTALSMSTEEGLTVNVGKKVTKIPAYLFCPYENSSTPYVVKIKEVIFDIDGECTTIGDYAFANCTTLKDVSLPNGIEEIAPGAFNNTTSLNYVKVMTANTEIHCLGNDENLALVLMKLNNKNITKVALPPEVKVIQPGAFEGCTKLTEITLTGSLKKIPERAFYGCTNLVTVNMGIYITDVGTSAFEGCTKLELISISYLKNIGARAFYGCTALKTNFLTNAETIEKYAFYNCVGLTKVELSNIITIGENAFGGCSNIKSFNFSDTLTGVDSNAFGNCTSLESIVMYGTIGSYAFSGCTKLSSATVYGKIYSNAFANCTGLKKLTIGETASEISSGAFKNCTALTEIYYGAVNLNDIYSSDYPFEKAGTNGEGIALTIGNKVTKIPAYIFAASISSYAPKITSVVFEETSICERIGNGAFKCCTEISNIDIPESVTHIGDEAFAGCEFDGATIYENAVYIGNKSNPYLILIKAVNKQITSCTIHEETKYIQSYAFEECEGLTSITIPANIERIEFYAFNGCRNIKDVYYSGNLSQWCKIKFSSSSNPLSNGANLYINNVLLEDFVSPADITEINGYAFEGCTSLKSVRITSNVSKINWCAFSECSNLESVAIEEGVTSIDSSVFYYCKSLKNISIPNSVIEFEESFFGCDSLILTEYENLLYIGSEANPYLILVKALNKDITTCTIPEQTRFILANALDGCTSITEIYFNAIEVADFGTNDHPFNSVGTKANGITLTIGKKVTKIPAYIFYCTQEDRSPKIVNVVFEEESECKSIGSYAFNMCVSLKKINLPDTIEAIGQSAFYGCRGLTEIKIPKCVKTIERITFAHCNGLKQVVIPAGVEVICDNAFSSCEYLTKVTFEDGSMCKTIEYRAFADCSKLTDIKLPQNLETMKHDIFEDCVALKKIVIPASVKVIQSSIFTGCTNLTVYCEHESKPNEWGETWNTLSYPKKVPVYWYAEQKPLTSGRFWHYVDGEVVAW